MTQLHFRLATFQELSALAQLVNRAYRDENQKGWTSEAGLVQGLRIQLKQLEQLLQHKAVFIVLLNAHEQIIASVMLQPQNASCEIGMLAVDPSLQNKGYGKLLLQYAEQYATQHFALKEYKMSVLSMRSELLAFYQRQGYQLTGETEEYPVHAEVGMPLKDGIKVLTLKKYS